MSKTETQSKALQLADACADDWHAVRSHLVVAELRRLDAENKALRADAERWRVARDSERNAKVWWAMAEAGASYESIDAAADSCIAAQAAAKTGDAA